MSLCARLFNDDGWMLEQFEKAEPRFNLLSSPTPFDLESAYRIEELQSQLDDTRRSHDAVIRKLEADGHLQEGDGKPRDRPSPLEGHQRPTGEDREFPLIHAFL